MSILVYVIPISLLLGLGFVAAFVWAVDSDQFEDVEKHSKMILIDNLSTEEERP